MTETVSKRCLTCLSVVAKCVSHKCNSTTLLKNVQECFQTPEQAEHLASELLKKEAVKNKLNDKGERSNVAVSLSQQHGKPLNTLVNVDKEKQVRQITSNDLCDLQVDLNLSDRQLRNVSTFIRKKTDIRKIIEPYSREKIILKSHSVDEFFDLDSFDFEITKKNVTTKVPNFAVICVDLMLYIQHIINKRDVLDFHLNFGVDGGRGSLKFTISIQSKQEFALVPDTQENYNNVKLLWSKLKINECLTEYPGTISTDLKLANIITGLSSNASYCPFICCDITKWDLSSCGTLRTTSSCLSNYKDWCNKGSVKSNAKEFKNCIHPRLFCSDKDQLILDVKPPPKLHLLLGCINTFYNRILELYPQIATKWAQQSNVERSHTNGGNFSFEGNACKALLTNVDKLQRLCESEPEGLAGCTDYVDVFRKFKTVVEDCFSLKLKLHFQKRILQNFKEAMKIWESQ